MVQTFKFFLSYLFQNKKKTVNLIVLTVLCTFYNYHQRRVAIAGEEVHFYSLQNNVKLSKLDFCSTGKKMIFICC